MIARFGLNHIIEFLFKEELLDPTDTFEQISAKGGKNKLGQSQEILFKNPEAQIEKVKGKAKSIIGQLQSMAIHKTEKLGRYSDATIGMLYNNIWGNDKIELVDIKAEIALFYHTTPEFNDAVILNKNNDNMTPMESSLALPMERIGYAPAQIEILNDDETGLTDLKKLLEHRERKLLIKVRKRNNDKKEIFIRLRSKEITYCVRKTARKININY